MAGEHDDAISRVGDLIATLQLNSICYVVQAREQRATTTNITTDISSRHICVFSLETRAWRVAITKVQYNRLSVQEPNCNPTRAKRSQWFHW